VTRCWSSCSCFDFFFFFFFQAEDGIRDLYVTGVQTCALPICHAFDDAPEGVPKDDLFLYEDALRHGRSVVIVLADDDQRAEVARAVLSANGAESLDAFRERWWKGLRDVEAAHYESTGQPFAAAEPDYRRGFECALGAGQRDRAYDDVVHKLKQRYPDVYN